MKKNLFAVLIALFVASTAFCQAPSWPDGNNPKGNVNLERVIQSKMLQAKRDAYFDGWYLSAPVEHILVWKDFVNAVTKPTKAPTDQELVAAVVPMLKVLEQEFSYEKEIPGEYFVEGIANFQYNTEYRTKVSFKDVMRHLCLTYWAGGDGVERTSKEKLQEAYGEENGEILFNGANRFFNF